MFGYTPFPCFRKLLKTHLSVRHARCWTTPRSVGVLPQIILFVLSRAFRALSCIPCTPNHSLKLMEIQKAGLQLVLGSTELSPNSASGVGSAVLNPEDQGLSTIFSVWGAASVPEFSTLSSLLFFGGVGGCHLCKYVVACAAVMATSASWVQQAVMLCFSNYLDAAIQDTEKLSFLPLTTLWKKSLLQCLWYVYYIIVLVILSYLSLLKTDLAKLIRGNLHSSYSLFTYLWTANCRNAICSLKFPVFAHFPFDSIVVKESCA